MLEKYKNTKKKIRKLWDKSLELENDISKLDRIKINLRPSNFAKSGATISVLKDHLIVPNTQGTGASYHHWSYNFEIDTVKGFPEWILPHIKLVPIFNVVYEDFTYFDKESGDSDFYNSAFAFTKYSFDYCFQKRSDNPFDDNENYKIVGRILLQFKTTWIRDNIPYYINLDLHIFNPKTFHEVHTKLE